MATSLQTITENLEKAPMGAIINPYTRGSTPRGRDDLFAISQALQTTLSLRPLIDIFFTELTEVMPITGLEYLDVDGELIHRVGERARNTLNYRLNLRNENLGTIVFRRRAKFSNDDASELESMLCCLLYPLRNALLYQDALAMAQKDALTGIGNRAAFNEALHHEVNLAKRHNHELSMVIIDIDHFKRINDTYGHSRGDCAIQTVVDAMQECIRSTDSFFRYGGEEFVMLLRNTDQHGAHLLADRIRARVEKMLCICDDEKIEMTVSAGISALRDNDSPGSLFDRTDSALYTAKRTGRNRVVSAD